MVAPLGGSFISLVKWLPPILSPLLLAAIKTAFRYFQAQPDKFALMRSAEKKRTAAINTRYLDRPRWFLRFFWHCEYSYKRRDARRKRYYRPRRA